MRPGEKLILPMWFRTTVVVAIVLTLLLSFTHSVNNKTDKQQATHSEQRAFLLSKKLRFIDGIEGTVSVVDAENDQEIIRLLKGEDGFMRSVMRGLVRERKAKGHGPEVPFELTIWEDGLVSLLDPATSRRVELSAFGIDNVKAFTRLLDDGDVKRNRSSVSPS